MLTSLSRLLASVTDTHSQTERTSEWQTNTTDQHQAKSQTLKNSPLSYDFMNHTGGVDILYRAILI